MKFTALFCTALCAVSFGAFCAPALAQDEKSGDVWSVDGAVTVVSDYRFRGFSLSDKDPAIQPELWVAHESGLYAGFWGSNVADLGGDDIEVDPAIGYAGSLGPVDVDVWAMWYLYPGASAYNYVEFGTDISASLGVAKIGVELGYAPAQDNIGGRDNTYAAIKGSMPIGATPLSLDGHFGVEDGAFGDNKLDWSVGLMAEIAGFEIGAHYIDAARVAHDPLADPTVVASVKYSF